MPRPAQTRRALPPARPPYFKTARTVAQLREGRTDWYRVNEATDNRAPEIFIYDEIGYFGVTAQDFVNDLQAIDASELTLRINSPGGDVFSARAIYNALVDHPATVTSIVDGLAASAASWVAMAGERIIMNRHSEMMIHDAAGVVIGNSADMREMADLLDRTSDDVAGIYAEKAGGSVDDWRAAMRSETWYSAQEAVDAGLADEVRGSGKTDAKNTFDLSIYAHAGRAAAPAPPKPEPVPDYAALAVSALERAFA